MNFKPYLFIILFNFPAFLNAQTEDEIIENWVDNMSDNMPEDFDYGELTERLGKYQKVPLNLNKATKEELKELFFLSPIQINNLLNHIENNGKLLEVYELQSISTFDLATIKLLLNFVTVNPSSSFEDFSLKQLANLGIHDYMLRYSRVLKLQKGFTIDKSSDRSRYLGSPDRLFSRYRFNYRNSIQFSLNIEKDAGEYAWHRKNGADFISASLYIKNIGRFKKTVVGDYSLQFGQALSLWSGLSFGKGADITTIVKQDIGLRPYTSVNEYAFFRGIATQINIGNIYFTPFISYRKLDSSSDLDENQNLIIHSLQQSGLHRTPNELANRKSVSQLVYGGNIEFESNSFSLGFNAYRTEFKAPFVLQSEPYKLFDFTGNNLTNMGIHYTKSFRNFYFFGEAAHSLTRGFAFLNGAMASLSDNLSFVVFQRNYQKNYHSFFNQAISENTNAYNETGFYSGFNYKYGKKYNLSFYTDLFKFPWLKYRVDAPSSGHDILGQFIYTPSKYLQFTLRYKLKEKEQNGSSSGLETYRRQNYRLEIQYQANKTLTLKNRAEMSQYKTASTTNKYGFMAFQDIKYSPSRSRFSGNLRYTLFDTQGFDTRIYAYENDVLYAYSSPGFQNKGMRFYINGRYRVKRRLDFWIKYSITKYQELTSIGSGLDEIEGNSKPEIKIQIRYRF